MLQKLRQRRKRAREKAEAERRETLVTSSDEEAAEDTLFHQQEGPALCCDGDEEQVRQPHFRCLDYADEDIIAGRKTETVQLQVNDRSLQQEEEDSPGSTPAPASSCSSEAIKALAREFALVKCSSYVSDAGIDKLLKVFIANHDVIIKLVQSGVMAGNYTKGVRPTANCPDTAHPLFNTAKGRIRERAHVQDG